jgi:hypothetical protein
MSWGSDVNVDPPISGIPENRFPVEVASEEILHKKSTAHPNEKVAA